MIHASKFSKLKHHIEIFSGADLLKMHINTNKANNKFLKKVGLNKRFSWKLNSAEFLFLHILIR